MFTIIEDNSNIIEIKKSRFLGYIFHTETEADFNNSLKSVKKSNPRADHIVYAYILGEKESGYSDANEPKGTAGRPVLNVLDKNDLCFNSLFVVRYFGGIKLGAGGLLRAYSQTASELISKCVKKELGDASEIVFNLKYDDLDRFLIKFKESRIIIIEKIFSDKVLIRAIAENKIIQELGSDIRVHSLKILRNNFLYPF